MVYHQFPYVIWYCVILYIYHILSYYIIVYILYIIYFIIAVLYLMCYILCVIKHNTLNNIYIYVYIYNTSTYLFQTHPNSIWSALPDTAFFEPTNNSARAPPESPMLPGNSFHHVATENPAMMRYRQHKWILLISHNIW